MKEKPRKKVRKEIIIGDEIYIGFKRKTDVYKRIYVNGIKTRYIVTLLGHVYNKETMHKLYEAKMLNGYLKALIYYPGGRKLISIHRLVALAFLDKPEDCNIVNHKDGNKENNDVDNLEWCTQSDNAKHAHATGLAHARHGEKSNFAKITNAIADSICQDIVENKLTPREIATKHGVSRRTVTLIYNRKRWIRESEKYDFSNYDKMRKVDKDSKDKAIQYIKEGKYSNSKISKMTGISLSYVQLLRKKEKQ